MLQADLVDADGPATTTALRRRATETFLAAIEASSVLPTTPDKE